MTLEFIGEIGVYFPDRDAIKFTALSSSGETIDCYVQRPALTAIGCRLQDGPRELIETFQKNRDLIELAAMIKLRRATRPMPVLDIGESDIRDVGIA